MSWDNPMNKLMLGPEMLKKREWEVIETKQNLNITQDTQSNYVDRNEIHKIFEVDVHVYPKIKLRRSALWRGAYKGIAPRWVLLVCISVWISLF